MRAVIYARYSTDMQNERSIEDQISLCRAYAAREGLTIVAAFEDRAVSGASMRNRPGIQYLMAQAKEGRFDVVLAESMSRIGRDQEDRAAIRKRLHFNGIKLMTPSDGVVTALTDGIRAVIDSQYLEDLKHMIHRGMSGLVKQGLSAGGKAYGYRPDPLNKGKLLIVEEEADIVRRIYAEYAGGKSPRRIARDLNSDRIAPPRGSKWNASTLNGNADRGYGILRNPLYAGRLVWNRVRMVKDPDTGKRVSRPNPKDVWQECAMPDLQIIPTELWESVQDQKSARSRQRPTLQRRCKRMLSGVLKCGSCGSGMAVNGADRSGRTRIRCSAATESGTCQDPKTFYLDTVETLVLDTVAKELRDPRRLALFIQTYIEERRRLAGEAIARRSRLERDITKAEREMDRIVDGIAKGLIATDDMSVGVRMQGLRERAHALKQELSQEAEVPTVVSLHPVALQKYEEVLTNLRDAVNRGLDEGEGQAAQALRNMVHKVTVYRDESSDKGVRVEIEGALNPLVSLRMDSHGGTDQPCVFIGGSGGGT